MPKVQVVHTTEYRYRRKVRLSEHRLMLRPHDSHDLSLHDATLGLTPPPLSIRWAHDVFGNSIAVVDFGDIETDLLSIVSTLDLEHFPVQADLPPDPLAENYPFTYAESELPDIQPLVLPEAPDPDGLVSAWATGFLSPTGTTRTLDMLASMTKAIKGNFRYEGRELEGTNPALVTLASGAGTCRDFALLMMEACRSLGLAARFISGYLYDDALADSTDPVVGGGATHAWCAIYLPGAGWVEFDPTNGLIAGRNLIRVAVARSPGQALPIIGSYIGGEDDFAGLNVNVQVGVGEKPPTPAQSQTQGQTQLT
jgi:transglutaminase-like putative cysteine protease